MGPYTHPRRRGQALRRVPRRRSRLPVLSAVALVAGLSWSPTAADDRLACGTRITEDTTLTGDLVRCPGDGLVVAADGITLDLGGYAISAANGAGDHAGLRLAGVTGVAVRNGEVTGFDAGVVIEAGGGSTVTRLTVVDNVNDGLDQSCDLGDGIVLSHSSGNDVTDNEVLRNGPFGGISVGEDSDANLISRNEVHDNDVPVAGAGCAAGPAERHGAGIGVRIAGPGADENRLDRNTVTGSGAAGIGLEGYVCHPPDADSAAEEPNTRTMVTRNRVRGSTGSGAHGIAVLQRGAAEVVCPAYGSTIERNVVMSNDGNGIFVSANSHDNDISFNVVQRNRLDGVHLHGPRTGTRFASLGPTVLDAVSPDLLPYVEGSDYRVVRGSGSGDVTAGLAPVDLALTGDASDDPQQEDTSTSGCEPDDYAAAGFRTGAVALLQRSTCTVASQIALAQERGASAVVLVDDGRAPSRTGADLGSLVAADVPVLMASHATGLELYQLTQVGPVTVRVTTQTVLEEYEAAPGAHDNVLVGNVGRTADGVDGYDGTREPPCDNNRWESNTFARVNQPCVATSGTGRV